MKIIPAINCQDFNCIKEKMEKAVGFGADWVQIDIADGVFTPHKTWNNPSEISNFIRQSADHISNLNLEIHLMVENPLAVIDEWIKAGARRIIMHIETIEISNLKSQISKLNFKNKNIEIGLALNPKKLVENLIPFFTLIDKDKKFVQILAVEPGLSGQKFQPEILDKIKFLKQNYSDIVVEVDGGINLETAKLCKEAGADILIVGSYIWNAENPGQEYEKLTFL